MILNLRSLCTVALAQLAILGGVARDIPSTETGGEAQTSLSKNAGGVPAFQRSFEEWKAACARLPANRSLRGGWPPANLLPLRKFQDFEEVVAALTAQWKSGVMAEKERWLGTGPARETFFNTATAYFVKSVTPGSAAMQFQPFVEKEVLPPGSEVFFHADFHGDIRSLLADLSWLNERAYLRGFEVARTNFYLVFLGDYTDRGAYGVEVLYTLFRLKVANPGHVFLLRGNHEDYLLQMQTAQFAQHGFLDEGRAKYGASFDVPKVLRAYDFLPVALYLGCGDSFIQCNHGGLEPGFDPRGLLESSGSVEFQFLGAVSQRRYLDSHPAWFAGAAKSSLDSAARVLRDFRPADPISPSPLGFLWNDFAVVPGEPQFSNNVRRAFIYGQCPAEFFLRAAGGPNKHLEAIFRGHQQSSILNPMMSRLLASKGVFRHWQAADSPRLLEASIGELAQVLEHGDERAVPSASVWTFNVSPDSGYGEGCGYSFDAFGILKLSREFADWRLRVINVPVEP